MNANFNVSSELCAAVLMPENIN